MKNTRKLLSDLYTRAGKAMNGGDPQVVMDFGERAAEYFGETIHMSFDGHPDDYVRRRVIMETFADAEFCFQMMDETADSRAKYRGPAHRLEAALWYAINTYDVPQDLREDTHRRMMAVMEATG